MADSARARCDWEKYEDDETQEPYYYNTQTGETSWEKPDDFLDTETGGAASAPADGSATTSSIPPLKPPRWRRFRDKSTDIPYFYDEANDVTQWDEPEGEIKDASDSEDEDGNVSEDGNEDGNDAQDPNEESDVSETQPPASSSVDDEIPSETKVPDGTKSEQNWVKHLDRTSGKPYYHDTISNTTQWETPENYTEASKASAISAEYLEYLNRSRAERMARVTQQALDPDGNLSRLNALLSKIDGAASNAGPEVDALEDVEQSLKERARAEWQQHVDPQTQRYYYHNIVTGETVWHKPDAPIVSALADWIPPETPEMDAQSAPRRMVSGQHYAATAKFNRVSGKFEKLGGEEHWKAMGVAGDRAGRQMSHFFDTQQLDKNREDAKRIKEELKRKSIDWKKVAAEKKAKKVKRNNEWIYQD